MATLTVISLFTAFSAPTHNVLPRQEKASQDLSSYAPQWVDLGKDNRHHRVWVRMQRDPRTDCSTLIEFFSDGHLVKSHTGGESPFLAGIPATVSGDQNRWMLFYDSHPGAGDTWFTNYMVIRRRDLRFEKTGQFEHGDGSSFGKTKRFYEYKLLKYQGDDRFQKLGVSGYKIIDWTWDAKRLRFRRLGKRYSPNIPTKLATRWYDPPRQRMSGEMTGTLDYFRPIHPKEFGLPNNCHVMINPGHGFGNWTVGLVAGTPRMDELHLIQGLKCVTGIDYPIGYLDPKNPPRLTRSGQSLTLTIATCAFRKVRVSRFQIQTKPYKIQLLDSSLKPEWTPFHQKS